MAHLTDISTSELRNALEEVDDVYATKRLMVAIAYKQGVTQTELAEWYGLSRKTVYNWLKRFDKDAIIDAVSDKARPGRPPKLDHVDQTKVQQLLQKSPVNAGYDAEEWDIPLIQRLIEEEFDITYSRTSAYRLFSSVE